MKPLYDRYRLVKQLLLSISTATVITTIVSRPRLRSKKKKNGQLITVSTVPVVPLLTLGGVARFPSGGQTYELHRMK